MAGTPNQPINLVSRARIIATNFATLEQAWHPLVYCFFDWDGLVDPTSVWPIFARTIRLARSVRRLLCG